MARTRTILSKPEAGPFALLVGAIITFTLLNATFASMLNVGNLLAFTPELGMIALAMTLLMTSGEFDLSVGSVFGFAPVVMWFVFNEGIAPLEVGFLIAIGIAVLIGLVNGLFITRLRIPSFLVTLGMLLVVRGAALLLTQGFPQRTWKAEGALIAEILVGRHLRPHALGRPARLHVALLVRAVRGRSSATSSWPPSTATGSRLPAATPWPPPPAASGWPARRSRSSS